LGFAADHRGRSSYLESPPGDTNGLVSRTATLKNAKDKQGKDEGKQSTVMAEFAVGDKRTRSAELREHRFFGVRRPVT
jgi:hypothetical protein